MPPGLSVDSKNSRIYGQVPDLDALYSFTIRATNVKDKYEDAIFRMEIIGNILSTENNLKFKTQVYVCRYTSLAVYEFTVCPVC